MSIVADPVLGRFEISKLLQVQPNTVSVWASRDLLPSPDMQTSRQRLWLYSTIRAWAIMTDRWPYMTDSDEPDTIRAELIHPDGPSYG